MAIKSTITHDEMRGEIRKALDRAGSQSALAAELGMSAQFITYVLNGAAAVSPKLAQKMGYERVEQEPIFKRIEKAAAK